MSTRSLMARAAVAATLGLAVTAAVPAGAATGGVVSTSGSLSDLAPASANPTDGAYARLVAYPNGTGTTAILIVTGLPASAVGTTFGAHVHTGNCVAGQPATAGPHFNIGGEPDAQHEVWLDFTVQPGGYGIGRTTVPFVIADEAANSVVIHQTATQPGGGAGSRLACLPADF